MDGEIDPNYERDWYAFDAVEGRIYMLDLTRDTSNYASMTLYGRNGRTKIEELYYWETQHIEWDCSATGRYYVRVSNNPYYYQPDSGTYQIRVTGLDVDLTLDNLWMYQNLPGATGCGLTASVSITNDPMGNTSYTYEWEFILPSDVSIAPTTVAGGGIDDPNWTFAARGCDEPNGISDSGEPFTVKVTVTGDDHGNVGIAEVEFGIALLGDVNNDTVINAADRGIINAFWRRGPPIGPFTLRDCDINCDGVCNAADRGIANAIWRGVLCQNSVSTPCPLR